MSQDWVDDWRMTVLAATDAAKEGGPLEGFLFHGTDDLTADGLAASGFRARSCWAIPEIAGIYARGRAYFRDSRPALVAVRLSDLPQDGLHYDERAIEDPVGRPYTQVRRIWEEWGGYRGGWRACLEATGSILMTDPVGPELIVGIIRSKDDLGNLAAHVPTLMP